MFIKATLHTFEFKRKEFSAAFDTAIQLEMRNAARAWYRAAVAQVPVRTGFAAGTLLNLTTAIGLSAATNRGAFLKREEKRRGKARLIKPRLREFYHHESGSTTLKTPEAARRFSTPPAKVFTNFGGKYLFHYGVSVIYYSINELQANSKIRNTPWKSFQIGEEAFNKYLVEVGLKRLPAIDKYISSTRVTVGRNGKTISKQNQGIGDA